MSKISQTIIQVPWVDEASLFQLTYQIDTGLNALFFHESKKTAQVAVTIIAFFSE